MLAVCNNGLCTAILDFVASAFFLIFVLAGIPELCEIEGSDVFLRICRSIS